MRLIACVMGLLLLGAPAAMANSFQRCGKTQIEGIEAAIDGAQDLAFAAAAAVGDTPEYRRWFGVHTDANGTIVRDNIKAIHAAITAGQIRVVCRSAEEDACKDSAYAFVFPNQAFVITLCPTFFDLPTMDSLPPGSPELEYGTRAGTIIHELSHFDMIGATDDICYSRTLCSNMARHNTVDAIANADSYQYFVEDVTFFPRGVIIRTGRARRPLS